MTEKVLAIQERKPKSKGWGVFSFCVNMTKHLTEAREKAFPLAHGFCLSRWELTVAGECGKHSSYCSRLGSWLDPVVGVELK